MTAKEKLDFIGPVLEDKPSMAISIDILEQTDFSGLTPEQAFSALYQAKAIHPFVPDDGVKTVLLTSELNETI